VCLCVNQDGTNHDRYTQVLVILQAETYTRITDLKLDQSDLVYWVYRSPLAAIYSPQAAS